MCRALRAGEEWNITHNDIRPSTIRIESKTAILKLADFCLNEAGIIRDKITPSRLPYTSPESLYLTATDHYHRQCTPPSDIFSLGVTLHEAMTQKPAFSADVEAEDAEKEIRYRI